jgi:hypothetical protein
VARLWESNEIAIWDATRDLGFAINRDRDLVKSARDTTEDRQTNFFILPKILYFRRLTSRGMGPSGGAYHTTCSTGTGRPMTENAGHDEPAITNSSIYIYIYIYIDI